MLQTAAALDALVADTAASLDLERIVTEVEGAGYSVVPAVFPTELTERAARHMDEMLAPQHRAHLTGAGLSENRGPVARSHPVPGAVMAELFAAPRLLAVAAALARAPASELRLLDQTMLRTEVAPPEMLAEPGPTARGWHVDDVFTPEMFSATPRQTYFQLFAVLRDILPGAGGTMVVPASHHRSLAVGRENSRGRDGSSYDAKVWSACDREALKADINARPRDYGIDTSTGVELPAAAGSLVVFCPSCLHSSSENRSQTGATRYVLAQSFYHHCAATLVRQQQAKSRAEKAFHPDICASAPAALRSLLGIDSLPRPPSAKLRQEPRL